MGRKRPKYQNTNKKPTYKGPYQNNPNQLIQTVKKVMRPETDGPTVDIFSNIDSTTDIKTEDIDVRNSLSNPKTKRPTTEKRKKKLPLPQWLIWVLSIFGAGFVSVVSTLVWSHSNKFVAVEKDISHIQEEVKEQKTSIKEIDCKVTNIDKSLELLNQKVDFKIDKNKK